MKAKKLSLTAALLSVLGGCFLMHPFRGQAEPSPEAPAIVRLAVAGDEMVVTVNVPPGMRRVVLESRQQLEGGAWMPRAVELTDGQGGLLTFRLPHSKRAEIFRIRADATAELPASFFDGPTDFAGSEGGGYWRYGPIDAIGAPEAGGDDNAGAGREVQESDIWQLRGDTLYFFNQLRGLQVINVEDPDNPQMTAQLALPAVGEQMYVLDDTHVVLLARSGCSWPSTSEVLVVKVEGSSAVVESVLPLEGSIQESRLVGSALYVVAQTYHETVRPVDGEGNGERVWEWGSLAVSFDLADPEHPVAADSLWFAGQGNVISANDAWLLVVTQEAGDWWQSVIRLVDISDPAGAMAPRGRVRPAGRVADKFKLNLDGDVLAVVSEDLNRNTGGLRASVLETFSLAQPEAPERWGSVEVGHGEALFATRFDGDRAYIVTFERIDPLWVVDLSDPRHPRVAGELEIPGWSTYIHPMGDRLVTIGIDNTDGWKVAVQLFDVHDPAQPALLSKVPLGENHSWSEANYDEKALKVLPDEGLILVPYQGWTDAGQANRLQLIEWAGDQLTARGVVEHSLSARRATSHAGRLLSVSGRELVVVDAADLDAPVVTARRDLAWSVDRLVVVDDYLIQVSDGREWGATGGGAIRVSRRDAPDEPLAVVLPDQPWPVVGLAVSEAQLYVLQSDVGMAIYVPEEGAGETGDDAPPNVALTVYGLASLPALDPVGSVTVRVDKPTYATELQPLWVRPGLLVWADQGGAYWRGWIDVPMMDVAVMPGRWWPWWGGGGGGLWVFDVADPQSPTLRSTVDQGDVTDRWGFSEARLAAGLIYQSFQQSEFIPLDPDASTVEGEPVKGRWVVRHFLRVIDLADPDLPTVWDPVNIPGELLGVSDEGQSGQDVVVYTLGPHFDEKGASDWVSYLDACAFDGTQAALVASLPLPTTWPKPVQTPSGWVLQRPVDNEHETTTLEAWRLSEAGAFQLTGATPLAAPLNEWRGLGESVVGRRSGVLDLFDVRGEAPVWLKSAAVPDCLWFDLNRVVLDEELWLPLGNYGVGQAIWQP